MTEVWNGYTKLESEGRFDNVISKEEGIIKKILLGVAVVVFCCVNAVIWNKIFHYYKQ